MAKQSIVLREVNASNGPIQQVLRKLHDDTFGDEASYPDFNDGHWWLGHAAGHPVAFAWLGTPDLYPRHGYLGRAGVVPAFRGLGTQHRLVQLRERRAKKLGWLGLISDTTDNLVSANNLISAGYHLFSPKKPWGFKNSLYWRKDFQ